MSPNQIREIIKRHEEKNDAIANKKKLLSLSSKAYKMFLKVELSSNKSGYTTSAGNSALLRILEIAGQKQP